MANDLAEYRASILANLPLLRHCEEPCDVAISPQAWLAVERFY